RYPLVTGVQTCALPIWDAGVMSYLSFSNTTFSAISTDTNEDNAVGNYNYTRTGTNAAQLDIAFTAPPDTANDSDSRLLKFISPRSEERRVGRDCRSAA